MNTDDQIRQGYRAKRYWAGKLVSVRLKRFRPSTFKHHLTRANGKYVLTTYRDEVQFIPVDIDFHPPALAEDEDSLFCDPEDLDATYAEFQASCERIVDVFERLGLKVIWYQSPGNIYNRRRWPGVSPPN